MTSRSWAITFIGLGGNPAAEWAGSFVTDSRWRMSFTQSANDGVEWESDETHEEEP